MTEVKHRMLAQFDIIINGESDKAKKIIRKVDNYLAQLLSPKEFRASEADNIMNLIDLSFEDVVASMEEAGVRNPKKLTVFEFYQRVEYYEQKKSKE